MRTAHRPHRRSRRGYAAPIIVILLVVLAVAIAATVWLRAGWAGSDADTAALFRLRRGSFDVTVPCSGELAALRQVEVRNKLESRAVITYIAPEGATIKAGDELIHLAEEEILNRIKDAEDTVNTASAALIAAQATLEIRRSARDSDLDKAMLEVELSQLALKGWLDGTVVSRLEQLSLDWETAKINYERLRDKHEESIGLQRDGFISSDELKQDEIAMIEAKARLDQANLDIEVYARYEYPQDEARNESAVEQAIAELERVQQRHEAELQTAQSSVESREYQLESAQQRLADLQLQHSYCSVKAPIAGLVVYASSMESGHGHRGNDEQPPQVGTELRPNELVMMLPDTSQMIAAVKVNEALSGFIVPGQSAMVISDALPDTPLMGEVMSIGVLAETYGWRDPNRRDYTVRIRLETLEDHALKPSMRCKANVHIERVGDALYVPVQAVVREGAAALVYVPAGNLYRSRQVQLGRASETFVEVLEGLIEGDVILPRPPRPEEIAPPQGAVLTSTS